MMTSPSKRALVVLIEDNADDEMVTVRALKRGWSALEIVVARDGQQAKDLLFGHGPPPDLILLDLKLPKVSGQELLQAIRAERRLACIPVVVFTSSAETSDISQCYSLGANSFIQKALGFEEYLATLQDVVHYWLGVNRALR